MGSNNVDIKQYVEEYYRGILTAEEKKQFEDKIVSDPVFAEEAAFYLSTIHAAKQLRHEETTERFKQLYQQRPRQVKLVRFKRPYLYAMSAVAAVLIAIIGYSVFFQPSTRNLASAYIKEHLLYLPQKMGVADSLQQGIALYNRQEYDSALQLFEGIYTSHPGSSEAKKDMGLTYLAAKNYDKAIQEFDELAGLKGLYASHALFLKAVTLMERNKKGDKEEAKQLLQQVVQQKSEGYKEAGEWLEKF